MEKEQYIQKKVVLAPGVHKDMDVVWFQFKKDWELIDLLKNGLGARWSQTQQSWYIQRSKFNLNKVWKQLKGHAWINYDQLSKPELNTALEERTQVLSNPRQQPSEENQRLINEFSVWLEHKRYSPNSIKSYTENIRYFAGWLANKTLDEVTNEDVMHYVRYELVAKDYSFSVQNQFVSALKLFFTKVVGQHIDIDKLERPRRTHKLPNVLSKEEVKSILNSKQKNSKHRAILSLIYACGLRRSELINTKISDVDSKRNLLIVRNAKGRKDRIIPLSEKTISMLREYYKTHKPDYWLFEGKKAGEQYSAESMQKILKEAVQDAKIDKPVTLHWLRHSYATHLLESGTDLRYIQEILGHKSSRTTEIYTHVSTQSLQKIKSPFDDL